MIVLMVKITMMTMIEITMMIMQAMVMSKEVVAPRKARHAEEKGKNEYYDSSDGDDDGDEDEDGDDDDEDGNGDDGRTLQSRTRKGEECKRR